MKILILTGPTATGKTAFAVKLASALSAEIVSADSRQVYCGLDIGSGKDITEYTLSDGTQIPYHLIDIADPKEIYSLADFMVDSEEAFQNIASRNSIPLVAGGTGMYIHALLAGYHLSGGGFNFERRSELRTKTPSELCEILRGLEPENPTLTNEPDNPYRLLRAIEKLSFTGQVTQTEREIHETSENSNHEYLVFGMLCDRTMVRERIEKRLDARLEEGMISEAQRLHDEGVSYEKLEFFGLEYKYLSLYLQNKISYREMRDTLLIKIRQFAKRQDTWFRKIEKEGVNIYWLRHDEFDKACSLANSFMNNERLPAPSFRLSDVNYGKKK